MYHLCLTSNNKNAIKLLMVFSKRLHHVIMAQLNFELAEITWNPTTLVISFGWLQILLHRNNGWQWGQEKPKNPFRLILHQESLLVPYNWKTPKNVFINSTSDLFWAGSISFIQQVFRVMSDNLQHTFEALTKDETIIWIEPSFGNGLKIEGWVYV